MLPQLACPTPTTCATVQYGISYYPSTDIALVFFNVLPDTYWQSYGWLWLIAAVIFCGSLLSYRFVNHTKR